jgi:hypothetical protein
MSRPFVPTNELDELLALFTSAERATVCGAAVNPGHAAGFEVSAEGLPKLLRDFGVSR